MVKIVFLWKIKKILIFFLFIVKFILEIYSVLRKVVLWIVNVRVFFWFYVWFLVVKL